MSLSLWLVLTTSPCWLLRRRLLLGFRGCRLPRLIALQKFLRICHPLLSSVSSGYLQQALTLDVLLPCLAVLQLPVQGSLEEVRLGQLADAIWLGHSAEKLVQSAIELHPAHLLLP